MRNIKKIQKDAVSLKTNVVRKNPSFVDFFDHIPKFVFEKAQNALAYRTFLGHLSLTLVKYCT